MKCMSDNSVLPSAVCWYWLASVWLSDNHCGQKYIVVSACIKFTEIHKTLGEFECCVAQRFHKLIHLHLFTGCFMKMSPQSSEQIQLFIDIWSQ